MHSLIILLWICFEDGDSANVSAEPLYLYIEFDFFLSCEKGSLKGDDVDAISERAEMSFIELAGLDCCYSLCDGLLGGFDISYRFGMFVSFGGFS